MKSNLDRYKKDLAKLTESGDALILNFNAEHWPDDFDAATKTAQLDPAVVRAAIGAFDSNYQRWYSECKTLIRQLLPDRLEDFVRHYEKPKPRKEITFENYRIEDALQGLTVRFAGDVLASPTSALPHIKQQINILKSIEARFESSLFSIRQLVQADLFDSELEAAGELQKKGFIRAAGAIAGVVLEKHLSQVADNHALKSSKKHPTISTFNDLLKDANVIEVPDWRKIQHLADIRNLCDHHGSREPSEEEITELINGVERVTKMLY